MLHRAFFPLRALVPLQIKYNIILHNGQILHERGFKGEGIDIAVIDAGFMDLLNNPTLNTMHIQGAKSFVYEDSPLGHGLYGD